ncbi:glycosyltransferase [Neptuniibacter sp. 1_MG-2023]|uniref:glycosyltransferase n=1 Tax=Neptuniibacter sp. 1_MG-2023 TaxID=3062662 RepID=UPI0026E38967|nr:glycosyltransferase [Neptuniibacter sp. 1_MG-2023]MDO6592765.1 glycosyltransferase [Neptuniibacter sp. 1_MG-2023]
MKRICMFVRNPVVKDARVLKEAETLVNQGYEVSVVGVQSGEFSTEYEKLPSGVDVYRVDSKVYAYGLEFFVKVCFFVLLAFVVLFNAPLATLSGYFERLLDYTISDFGYVMACAFYFFLIFWGLKSTLKAAKRYLRYRQRYLKLDEDKNNSSGLLVRFITATRYLFKIVSYIRLFKLSAVALFLRKNGAIYGHYAGSKPLLPALKPDVIHAHDISTLPLGVAFSKKYGIPLIYDAHELYEDAVGVMPVTKLLYKCIHWFSQKHVDGFITISESFSEIYKKRYPLLPNALVVMNATRYVGETQYDGRLHKATGLSSETKIILFQGGFTDHRGINNLLLASKYLKNNWCLVFMGWGKLQDKIEEQARKTPNKVKCIDAAPQSELACWTSGATVGVIPYEDHGLNHKYCTPNKLWEYPNAAVPIMASPRVELSRIVTSNGIGEIFEEPVIPSEFAIHLMLSDEKIQLYKNNCRVFAKEQSWGKYEKGLVSLYDDILRNKA